MSAPLKHLRMASKEAHTATVIFLHGLGDTGNGWLPVAKMLWGQLPNVKWILPHAPTIPITVNGGYRTPGWFDVITFDRSITPRPEDEAGILATVEAVDKLIQAEVDAGIPENRIVLGGFSQGGAIAVVSQLIGKRNLAGYVSLSTWVPLAHKMEGMARKDAKDFPLFWGHGRDDEIVQYEYGRQSIELLKRLGFVEQPADKMFARPGLVFRSYPGMGHSACNEEIADLAAWLTECLKTEGAN
ncbi:hypothetical protein CspHIS471_0508400 [Cutaneotrichosporon sp. HIS471]|nr:hypothetical protein CspHIS471_0508400 [Cutaneotrichosporon sp. HIS471]